MKSHKIIILIILLVISLVAIYFLAVRWGDWGGEGTAKIGVILPLEHKYLLQAQMMKKSADLAAEEINSQPGGKKIKLIYEDGGCETNKATQAAEDLVDLYKVKFIIGGFCESESLAIAKLAQEQAVIVLSPISTNPKIVSGGDNIFNLAVNQASEGLLLSRYLSEELASKKIAIVREAKEYASALSEDFKRDFFIQGGSVEEEIIFTPRTLDISAISKQLNNRNFEALLLVSELPAVTSQIVSQLKNSGSINEVFVSSRLFSSDSWQNYNELDGVYTVLALTEDSTEFEKFKENYLEKYKEEAKYAESQATIYSAVYLAEKLSEKYGADLEGMKDYLLNLKKWPHALGSLTFDSEGNRVLPYVVYQLKDGALTEVSRMTP